MPSIRARGPRRGSAGAGHDVLNDQPVVVSRSVGYRDECGGSARLLTLAAAVVFLNEEELLPRMLASLERQLRFPELLLLVDDGSDDRSSEIAGAFAAQHAYARVFTRARRPESADRLGRAAELIAFQSALGHLESDELRFDVYAKLDADLELPPDYFARVMHAFETEPRVGIAGSQLSLPRAGRAPRLERSQPWHVRGATKFYRRECLDV